MDLRQLTQFAAVAEARSFRRAAERLQMTQPPLSFAVRRLEEELNVRLFDRTSRSVQLTEAGKALLEGSRTVMAALDAAIQSTRRTAQGFAGKLSVALSVPWAYDVAPAVLRNFRATHPGVVIGLHEVPSSEQARRILNGSLDIGFLRLPDRYATPGLKTVTLREDRLTVVLPAKHALAARKTLSPRDLRDAAFVLPPFPAVPGIERFSFRIQVENLCLGAGYAPRVAQEASQMQSIVRLVETGLGISIVPGWARTHFSSRAVFRRLSSPSPACRLRLVAAWNADNPSPVLQAFVQAVRRAEVSSRARQVA